MRISHMEALKAINERNRKKWIEKEKRKKLWEKLKKQIEEREKTK